MQKSLLIPRIFKTIFIVVSLIFIGCSSENSSTDPGGHDEVRTVEIVLPKKISLNEPLPIVATLAETNPYIAPWETLHLSSPDAILTPQTMSLKRGKGSVTAQVSDTGIISIELRDGLGILVSSGSVHIEAASVTRDLSGSLTGADLIWDSTAVIHLTGETVIPPGAVLTIGSGTRVELDFHVRLVVQGVIHCTGNYEAPVLFAPRISDSPWGEIYHENSSGDYAYTFFTGGGGDESRKFGHSNSQPVLAGENCTLMLNNVYIIDNPGKALGFRASRVDMIYSLISRCDTGGELAETRLHFDDCYFLDIPNDDAGEMDDDNDALYVVGSWAVRNDRPTICGCVFVTGKDDGIDHNDSDILISGCIIEDYANEGIAASGGGEVEILNTLVLRCEQGIEAGYGSPQVLVNHCVCLENEIGLRFGDSYDWGCNGMLSVSNSIITGNSLHNIRNYDLLLGGPQEGAISITYSIVNQSGYDDGEGCMTGVPRFTSDYRLQANSPGVNAASDGLDMGLLPLSVLR